MSRHEPCSPSSLQSLCPSPILLHPSFSSREPFPSVLNPSEPSPSHSHSVVPPPCPGLPQTSSPCPGGFGGALTGFRVPAPRISSAPRAARSAAAPCRVAADLPSLLGHLRGTNASHLPGRRLSGRGRRSPGAQRRPERSTACTVHSPKPHLTPTPENEEGSASLELPLPARSHTHTAPGWSHPCSLRATARTSCVSWGAVGSIRAQWGHQSIPLVHSKRIYSGN